MTVARNLQRVKESPRLDFIRRRLSRTVRYEWWPQWLVTGIYWVYGLIIIFNLIPGVGATYDFVLLERMVFVLVAYIGSIGVWVLTRKVGEATGTDQGRDYQYNP